MSKSTAGFRSSSAAAREGGGRRGGERVDNDEGMGTKLFFITNSQTYIVLLLIMHFI